MTDTPQSDAKTEGEAMTALQKAIALQKEKMQVQNGNVSGNAPALESAPPAAFVKPPTSLLMGGIGTGKTFSICTYAKAGLKVRAFFTDPGGEESLLDAVAATKAPLELIDWAYVAPSSVDWGTFEKTLRKVTDFNYELLSKEKSGVEKAKHRQFYEVLKLLSNFKSRRTGKELGPVDSWGDDTAFVFDSITGLNQIARDHTVGSKPTPHQGEWGIMMDLEERLVNKLVGDCNCFVACIAHTEKVMDEQAGIPMFNPAFLGNKLAPRVPRMFSDVILAKVENGSFMWSTMERGYNLKARNLPISGSLPPDFGQIVRSYKKRLALVNAVKEQPNA